MYERACTSRFLGSGKKEPVPKVGEGGSGVANRVEQQKPIPHSSAIVVVMPEYLTRAGPKSPVITAEDVVLALLRGAAESLVLLALGGAPAFRGNRMAGSRHTDSDPVAAGT